MSSYSVERDDLVSCLFEIKEGSREGAVKTA